MSSSQGGNRQRVLLGVAVVIFAAAAVWAWRNLSGDTPADIAANRAFYCAETGKFYEYVIQMGDTSPYPSPYSGKKTGYRAEACYWTKDANGRWGRKEKPTLVIVAKEMDETTEEKTYCPDCGREVVRHNPMPLDADIARANGESGE